MGVQLTDGEFGASARVRYVRILYIRSFGRWNMRYRRGTSYLYRHLCCVRWLAVFPVLCPPSTVHRPPSAVINRIGYSWIRCNAMQDDPSKGKPEPYCPARGGEENRGGSIQVSACIEMVRRISLLARTCGDNKTNSLQA